MSNISHNIRKFNRFELKYLVPLKTAEKFKHDLRAYLAPDEHGDSNGSYDVSSLYFDGPDYRFYWEKVDGLRFRRKLRIRHYETNTPLAETTPVYLEIKQRLNKVTQKRRVKMSYRDAKRLCEQRIIPAHTLDDAPVIEEITGMLWQYDLRPASIIRYSRQAFIGSEYDVGYGLL